MKLKNGIDYTLFLRQVRLCAGTVEYETLGGDRLNLKSVLSEYLFVSAAMSSDLLAGGTLHCALPADCALLAVFLAEAE